MLGFSVNTLSMFGLVLAIGIVVDDAIVVVEAVMHHIEHGMPPREATAQAMKEVSAPVIGIALILSAVFIPVAFVGGLTGRMYQQFALTIAISVLLSAFSALSLSPALRAMFLKPTHGPGRGPLGAFFRGFNWVFDRTTDGYVERRPAARAQGRADDHHRRGGGGGRRSVRPRAARRVHSRRGPGPARRQRAAAARRIARADGRRC